VDLKIKKYMIDVKGGEWFIYDNKLYRKINIDIDYHWVYCVNDNDILKFVPTSGYATELCEMVNISIHKT